MASAIHDFIHKGVLKKIGFILCLVTLCLLTSHCGFRLKNQNRLPPAFCSTYVASDQPYDKFTLLLKQHFMQMGLKLSGCHNTASIILKIIEARLTHSSPDVTTSDKARSYFLTYQVRFSLESADGRILLPEQAVSTRRTLTLNPGQTLYSNNELNLFKQEMQREALILLLYRLETQQVRDALL